MERRTRREFLGAAGIAAAAALAGCSLADGSGAATLGGVLLANPASTATEFDVLVQSDDEVVHWASYEVGPAPDRPQSRPTPTAPVDTPDGVRPTTKKTVSELPTDTGATVVHGRVGDQRATVDLSDTQHGGQCIAIAFFWEYFERGELVATITPTEHIDDPPTGIGCS